MQFEEFESILKQDYPIEMDTDTYVVSPTIGPDLCESGFYDQQVATITESQKANRAEGLEAWIRETQLILPCSINPVSTAE